MSYLEFLNTCKYYHENINAFTGFFNVIDNHVEKLYLHFINTGENLLNDYVDLVHLSWEVDNKDMYLDNDDYLRLSESQSKFREYNFLPYYVLLNVRTSLRNARINYVNHISKLNAKPRKLASIFISNKKIRRFIFKRDDYKCLSCGGTNNLSIDHINPVNRGGENKLSNLQTLCKSCNSKKSDKYKDYR